MEIEDLTLFREIIRLGSLTKAGEEMALSQPTVTRRLQRLEVELRTVLLERASSHLRPTSEGLLLLDFADQVLPEWDRFRQLLRRKEELSGDLRVAASSTPGGHWAADWVAKFAAAFRGVQLKLSIMDSRAVEDAIEAGQCIVGFMGCPPKDPSVQAVSVAEDEILLVAPTVGRFSEVSDPLPPSGLGDLWFIQREEGSGTRETVMTALASERIDISHRVALEVDSTAALLAAVRAGIGVSFISKHVWAQHPVHGAKVLRIAGVPLKRKVLLVYDPLTLRHCPQAEAFVEFVQNQVRAGNQGRDS